MTGRIQRLAIIAALLLGAPHAARACEPVVQMMILYAGVTWNAPLMIPSEWAEFALYTIVVVVVVKMIAFAAFERRLSRPTALFGMLAANAVSSVAGVVTGGIFAGFDAFIFMLPLTCLLAIPPLRRLRRMVDRPRIQSTPIWATLLVFVALVIVNTMLFGMAMGALSSRSLGAYWILKYAYLVLGLGIGIILTTLWEEWSIAVVMRKALPGRSFYTSVLRANFVTFGVVFLAGAISRLPARLASPDFLVWLRDVLGLG